jgi:4'-phosphopantetheinyl transferase
VARGREVGVDVERLRSVDDWDSLGGRFFAPREVAELGGIPGSLRERAFFACWTRKEAYVKAHGLGLALPLDGFVVSVDPAGPARLLAADHDPDQLGRWEMCDVSPGADYAGALAVEGHDWRLWCGTSPW